MHRAELFFPNPRETAATLHAALTPDARRSDVPKTAATVTLAHDGLRIEIEADDVGSLRAAINSWLRWLDAAQEAARIGRG